MSAVALVVMILAAARVTRLVTTDDITEGARMRLVQRYRGPLEEPMPLLLRLIFCDWCVAFWIAAGAALLGRATGLVHSWTWAAWSWPAIATGAALTLRLA